MAKINVMVAALKKKHGVDPEPSEEDASDGPSPDDMHQELVSACQDIISCMKSDDAEGLARALTDAVAACGSEGEGGINEEDAGSDPSDADVEK